MAQTGIYLNFMGKTEEAFNFYKGVFGGEFQGGINRLGEVPPQPGMPNFTDAEKNMVMHIALPILGGTLLMGTDAVESMGHKVTVGNNVHISLHPDTRADADKLFKALSDGGKVEMQMQEMFWGDYYGSFADQYGIQWMINTSSKV